MEFNRILEQLSELVKDYINNGHTYTEQQRMQMSTKLISLTEELIIEGVALRSTGHSLYNASEYKVLKTTVLGLNKPTMSWLYKVNKSMPDVVVTLRFIKELDQKSFNSILWLLDPEN